MRKFQIALLTLVMAITIGCSSQKAAEQPKETSNNTVQQPAGPIDARSKAPDVDDMELGRSVDANKRVVDGVDDFTPKDTIYLSLKTDGAAANSEVKVRWTFKDGQLVKEEKRTIKAGGDAWTEFHISKPSGFPVGDYTVTAFVNGDEKGKKTFEVKNAIP
ncbi:MAG TPA: hypothetical protein VM056_03145 [Terriglobales bacterium]|nr:hypothetical protein [Terriglobales bacterium]